MSLPEEDRDLELDIHAQPVEQEAEQDGACVEIQHLLHAVVGVVIEEFVQPLQGMLVGLTDAAEVAGDGLRAVQVNIRAVGAFGIERLDVSSRR